MIIDENAEINMDVIADLSDYKCPVPTSVALGRFDGLHPGHRRVITSAVDYLHTIPAVFTFEQSPHGIISGEMVYSLLTPTQKQKIISALGVKLYFAPSFMDVKDMMPEEFVTMLKEKLNARHISCGFNFTFGKDGKGNPAMLKELCAQNNMTLTVVPPIEQANTLVSSSQIRKYLMNGEVEKASEMLGYDFFIDFPVIHGDERGRKMNFPTINQKLPLTFIHPKYGVYATKTYVGGNWYKSISNIGVHPTVGADYPRCETNILDFDGELYGDNVIVRFYKFLRDEMTFENIDELQTTVMKDIESVRQLDY